ncbi:MAG: hypothetical protein HY960_10980 [Ignavibacteriae bacterium]|nr:hypothetical protein [Ignavibacteriota bacterium]
MPTITETVDNLDEAKILGYFEVIRGTFLTKILQFLMIHGEKDSHPIIARSKIPNDVIAQVKHEFGNEKLFFQALELENEELYHNLMEDILTSILVGSWITFEQIAKDIPNPNYSHNADDQSLDYKRGDFGFSKTEKDNLDLFYYIRNSIQHHNGAYFASREVNAKYNEQVFQSIGHIGEKMIISLQTAYKICLDLERLSCKAWSNYQRRKYISLQPSPL